MGDVCGVQVRDYWGSVKGAPARGRCGPEGLQLEGPRTTAAREVQGIAAHGAPEGQLAASAAIC